MMWGVVRSPPRAMLLQGEGHSTPSVAIARSWSRFHIMEKRIVPHSLAVALLGKVWKGGSIHCQSDYCGTI